MTTWESFVFTNFALREVEAQIKTNKFKLFELDHLSNPITGQNYKRKFNKGATLGIVDHLLKKTTPERAILEPVSFTENYLQDLCEIVYKDFPERLLTKEDRTSQERDKQQIKLLSLIVKSADREEMIERIIEEKIRGVFYGNPLDFYSKDKANIGIGDYFKANHLSAQAMLSELIARRNIFVHNEGRVDSKYLREVAAPTFKLSEKPKVTEMYIRDSILVLRGFAGTVTKIVIEHVYKKKCTNQAINGHCSSFNKNYP
jgi:hypothetical protein